MEEDAREEWLRNQQDGRVYPVGRALRATFDAENHDTLGSDVAGLMINLSRVPDPCAKEVDPPAAPPSASALRPSILARVGLLFGRR